MDIDRLAKVLALAASDNDAEAVHALRTAHRLLAEHGTDFIDLTSRLARAKDIDALEDAMFDLRNEIRTLRAENERLRQGRFPVAPAPAADLFDATRTAAEVIRLRAEIDIARADAAQARAIEEAQQDQYRLLLEELTALSARLGESEGRRIRLESENRRLAHANHSLSVELAAAHAQDGGSHAAIALALPERSRKGHAAPPASDKSRGQYALF